MKRLITAFLALALAVTAGKQACAQSSLPDNLWEQLPQGFAIALTYNKSFVTLNIKTTSDTAKQIQRSRLNILLFYKDEHGALIPLSNQKEQKKPDDLEIDPPDSRGPMTFPPKMGLWYQVGVRITPEDWSLIRSHPVVCRIELYDLTTNTKIHLESSPRQLAE